MRTTCWIAGTAAVALLALAASPAAADKVGVATAVNPDATGHAPGISQRRIVIGQNVVHDERIATTGNGLVQVLFVDGSTFTVGPNSNLVIDKYVYNPQTNEGELAASFSKGVLRFVGGKMSKQKGRVNVQTPAGSLAIRGGMFQGSITNTSALFSFLFGDEMVLSGKDGEEHRVFEPGYTIDALLNGGFSLKIRQTTSDDTHFFLTALSGKPGSHGGSGNPPDDGTVQNSNIADNNSNNPVNIPDPSNDPSNGDDHSDTTGDGTTDLIRNDIDMQQPGGTQDGMQSGGGTTNNDGVTPPTSPDLPDGQFFGFAAGLREARGPYGGPPTSVGNTSPQDVALNFNAGTATLSGNFKISPDGFDPFVQRYVLEFGGTPGTSGVTGQDSYAAIQGEGSKVFKKFWHGAYENVSVQSVLIGSGQIDTGDFVTGAPFCNGCDFIKWGLWGTVATFGDHEGHEITDVIDQGFFIAGDVTHNVDLPTQGSAHYTGDVLGDVASFHHGTWDRYLAKGDLNLNWNFAYRAGYLSISHFDGNRNFGGPIFSPRFVDPDGLNRFSGSLHGWGGLNGASNGAFVRGPNGPAEGVIGNWNVSKYGYRATGIFGGTQQSYTPGGPPGGAVSD